MQALTQILTALALALAVVLAPLAAQAQESQLFDQEHRQEIYEVRKLSYGKAAALSVVPGLGNFYVDQYLLGGLAIISMVFAGFFVGYGLTTDQPGLTWTGAGIAGVTYGWSIGTTMWGVGVYNDELRRNLHIDNEKAARQQGVRLSISW